MKIAELFKKATDGIKRNYNYVPPCPCCGSVMTGRYVKQHKFPKDNAWILEESFKNGEIVALVPEIGEDTAFCFQCGYRWPARIQNVWLSRTEVNHERKIRNTDEIFESITDDGSDKKKKKLHTPLEGYFGRR